MPRPASTPLLAALLTALLGAPGALAGPATTLDSLPVARVVASSTRAGTATNLADGDLASYWSPGGPSPRFAWIRFDLASLARVDGLVIANGVAEATDREVAAALGRVRTAWVLFDDGQAEVIRLDPTRGEPRRVFLARAHATRSVTMVIREVELGERWNQIALSEVTITGQRGGMDHAGSPPLSAVTPCGGAGWLPLRDAVVRRCGDPGGATPCEDPLLDVVVSCRADPERPLPLLDLGAASKSGGVTWAYRGRWFALRVNLQTGGGDSWRVADLGFDSL